MVNIQNHKKTNIDVCKTMGYKSNCAFQLHKY